MITLVCRQRYSGISIFALPLGAPSVSAAVAALEQANEFIGVLNSYTAIYGFQGEPTVVSTEKLGDFLPWGNWLEKITDDFLITVMNYTGTLISRRLALYDVQSGKAHTRRVRGPQGFTRVAVTEEELYRKIEDVEHEIKTWLGRYNSFLEALGFQETLDDALAKDINRCMTRARESQARNANKTGVVRMRQPKP